MIQLSTIWQPIGLLMREAVMCYLVQQAIMEIYLIRQPRVLFLPLIGRRENMARQLILAVGKQRLGSIKQMRYYRYPNK